MRLITDLFAYCGERIPQWNTISISGYHMREAGATAAQEIAFTLANGIAYVQAAIDAGLAVDDVRAAAVVLLRVPHELLRGGREVPGGAAACGRRIMRERFGAKDPRSQTLRFHTQTGGATLTAQQPENNIVRTALEALAAVLGGTQSLHTNSFDEALALPDRAGGEDRAADPAGDRVRDRRGRAWSIRWAARTTSSRSPTSSSASATARSIEKVDAMGGAVAAIEAGFYQDEIHEAAFRIQRAIEDGDRASSWA